MPLDLNGTESDITHSLLDKQGVRVILSVCYIIVFITCILGNTAVLVVVSWHRDMRTVTNFFLANLALADLFVGIFCIIQNFTHLIVAKYAHWPFGSQLCYLYIYVLHLGPSVSAGILLLLAIERCVAIIYPVSWPAKCLQNKTLLGIATAVVWLSCLGSSVPYYLTAKYHAMGKYATCTRRGTSHDMMIYLITTSFVVWYLVPATILILVYAAISAKLWYSVRSTAIARSSLPRVEFDRSTDTPIIRVASTTPTTKRKPLRIRSWGGASQKNSDSTQPMLNKISLETPNTTPIRMPRTGSSCRRMGDTPLDVRRKVVRLLIVVTLAFILLTLPNHSRLLWTYMRGPLYSHEIGHWSTLIQPVGYILLFLNSAINPFLYAFLSLRFRGAFCDVLTCKNYRENRRHIFLERHRSILVSTELPPLNPALNSTEHSTCPLNIGLNSFADEKSAVVPQPE